jgi:hypothetical protein
MITQKLKPNDPSNYNIAIRKEDGILFRISKHLDLEKNILKENFTIVFPETNSKYFTTDGKLHPRYWLLQRII